MGCLGHWHKDKDFPMIGFGDFQINMLSLTITYCLDLTKTVISNRIFGQFAVRSYVCVTGRGGESIKLVTSATGASVVCSREKRPNSRGMGSVTIRGTRQQVKQAKVNHNSFGFSKYLPFHLEFV